MRVIKKYPNRRLYDTKKSKYIKMKDVLGIIRDEGDDLQVVDDDGNDITRSVLIQIILEQENGDSPIFTNEMLTRFIRVYDDAAQSMFGDLLDRNLQLFSEQQKRMQAQVEDMVASPVKFMQDMAERNMNMWQEAQKQYFSLSTFGKDKDGDE